MGCFNASFQVPYLGALWETELAQMFFLGNALRHGNRCKRCSLTERVQMYILEVAKRAFSYDLSIPDAL